MGRICLYYRNPPESDRWLPGDRFIRPMLRRAIRGRRQPSGVDKVFINLGLGLDRLGIPYLINPPFRTLREDDRVGVLGRGRYALDGYDRPNPIVAGIGLMTHPSEWPDLCEQYPVVRYLQHSTWASDVYRPYFGDKCGTWPVGIDTRAWIPANPQNKKFDFLIYDKIRWQRESLVPRLLNAVKAELARRSLRFMEIRYGRYKEEQYQAALQICHAVIFLCEHESQGLAYQEGLAAGLPVLAWDQGCCLDPNRFKWRQPNIPATSVPYFDERCGLRFRDIGEFPEKLTEFLDLQRSQAFAPRDYISETLTLEKCSADYLRILEQAPRSATAVTGSAVDAARLAPPSYS
jgi:glycosyltransferase involved in cell wall biosynthesis